MIIATLRLAHRVDETLSSRIGRPYRVLLSIGLVLEIVRRVHEISELPASDRGYFGLAIVLLFYGALLINQLGELSERLDHHHRRR